MALKYISKDTLPVYTCLSTDINSDRTITGASIIGATVFTTDTENWYIIRDDLTIDDYVIPSTVKFDDSGNMDGFSRLRTSQPNSIFNSTFRYDLQPAIFEQVTSNGGSISHSANLSSATLTTSSNPASSSKLVSREYHRYYYGKSQLIFMTTVFGEKKSNVKKRVGYFDSNDGIFLEQNGTTDIAWVIRTSTSGSPSDARRVVQEDWNLDKLDGKGTSGVTIDLQKSQILIIDFQWLGMGRVRVGFDVGGKIVYCHEFLNANNLSVPYMKTGALPVCWEIVNVGTADGSSLIATCSSVLSEGGFVESESYQFGIATGASVTCTEVRTPILAIRPKATFGGQTNRIKIRVDEFAVLAGNNTVVLEAVYNPTISVTGSWTSVDAGSAVEYHQTIASISGGTLIKAEFCPSTSSTKNSFASEIVGRTPLVLNSVGASPTCIVICARTLATPQTSECYASINWREII